MITIGAKLLNRQIQDTYLLFCQAKIKRALISYYRKIIITTVVLPNDAL